MWRRVVDPIAVIGPRHLDGETIGDTLSGQPQGRIAVGPGRHRKRPLQNGRGRVKLSRHADRIMEVVPLFNFTRDTSRQYRLSGLNTYHRPPDWAGTSHGTSRPDKRRRGASARNVASGKRKSMPDSVRARVR